MKIGDGQIFVDPGKKRVWRSAVANSGRLDGASGNNGQIAADKLVKFDKLKRFSNDRRAILTGAG